LRETQISQKYRYPKKTQLSLDPKKYRYVGEITSFETEKTLVSKIMSDKISVTAGKMKVNTIAQETYV